MSFFAATLKLFFGRIASGVLMLLSRILIARACGPIWMGALASSTTSMTVLSRILSLGLGPAAHYHSAAQRKNPHNIFPALFIASGTVALLATALIFFAQESVETFFFSNNQQARQSFRELLPFLPALFVSLPMLMSLLGEGALGPYNFASAAPGLLLCAGAGLALLRPTEGPAIVFISQKGFWFSGAALAVIFSFWINRKRPSAPTNFSKQLFSYGFRAALVSGFSLALDRGALLAGNHFVSPSELGLYAVAATFSEGLNLLYGTVNSMLITRLSGENAARSLERTVVVSRLSFLFSVVSSIALALSAFWLVPLLFGRAFSESAYVLIYLLPGLVGMVLQNTTESYLYSRNRPELCMLANLVVLLVLVSSIFLLGPRFGARGLAVATSLANLAGAVAGIALVNKIAALRFADFVCVRRDDIDRIRTLSHDLLARIRR